MGREIERKFLVAGDSWRDHADSRIIRQGYISVDQDRTVRVRKDGDRGYLTIKGISVGASRAEYEYEIPAQDAGELLETLCIPPHIEKTRHVVVSGGMSWEIDEFSGVNEGLIVAEVELETEDQQFELPPWIGAEVTGDPRYFNARLVEHPYSTWSSQEP